MATHPIRNVGVIAHIDAGKTTVTERFLYYSHKEHRIGEVDEGTAAMDWMPEEQRRGITITAAATAIDWRDHEIQIVDTPGHVDFTSEVERSLRVLDGAVGVFCGTAGVQAQSETVWRQADRYGIPRIAFVNKLDRVGADFFRVVEAIRTRLRARPVPLQVPIGSEKEFEGVVDLLERRALRFPAETLGEEIAYGEVPSELEPLVGAWRERIVEAVADFDESVMEAFVDGREVPVPALRAALRRATISGEVVPVLCGAALRNIGVQPLMDAVCDYLPAPGDIGTIVGQHPETGEEVTRALDSSAPFCGLAFKTVADAHADLVYVRVYSGRLSAGDQVRNGRTGRKDRAMRLFRMHANHREKMDVAEAGRIVGVVGFHDTSTGDSIYDPSAPILVSPPVFPDTVVTMAVEPDSVADRPKLLDVLEKLAREDPTFRWAEDREAGQLVIMGMGELHLEVICHRIRDEFSLRARVGRPRVSYRQTVRASARAVGVFDREVGDRQQYARVEVEVEPSPESLKGDVVCDLPKDVVPLPLQQSMRESLASCLAAGGDWGLPLTLVTARVVDAEYRPNLGTVAAFSAATSQAFRDAIREAETVVLEPLMRFEIEVPDDHYGTISTDLSHRRAEIGEVDLDPAGLRIIRGTVPLSEVFGYTNVLRALSQGRGSMSLQPESYQPVPAEVQKRFVAET